MTISRLLLSTVTVAACILVAPLSSQANSLYNKKNAKPLTDRQKTMFGPNSGKYRYDSRMIRAAEIAAERARRSSTSRCWRYVKTALLAAKVIETYPKTTYAKEAGLELSRDYGFKKIRVQNPYAAPVGAVLVYGGRGAGHVEIRTKKGFVSDFQSPTPSPRPLIGVFIKV